MRKAACALIVKKSASSKTIEFRIKPKRSDAVYHLLTLSGSKQTTTHGNLEDFHLVITLHLEI